MPLKILIETYISWVEQSYINENCKIKILSSFFLKYYEGGVVKSFFWHGCSQYIYMLQQSLYLYIK